MKPKQLPMHGDWILFIGVIVAVFVFAAKVPYNEQPIATGGFLCLIAVILFGLALDMRTPRVRKGILIIGLGVITTMLYKFGVAVNMECALKLSYDPETCKLDLPDYGFIAANTIDTVILLISIACGGIGGSILAAHGDVTATDAKSAAPADPGDIQTLLESIDSKLDRQNAKLNLVCAGAFGVLLLVIVRVFS